MTEVSLLRLYLLRAMYLLIAAGLATTVWPHILFPSDLVAGPKSVIRALLGALAVMCLVGLRYPLQCFLFCCLNCCGRSSGSVLQPYPCGLGRAWTSTPPSHCLLASWASFSCLLPYLGATLCGTI